MSLSLAHINVRSLTNNFLGFKEFILQEDYDIVGLSETWLSEMISSDVVQVNNYNFIRKDRASRGGGVGLYLKSYLKYEILQASSSKELEQLWVKIYVRKKSILIGVVYRPPDGNLINFLNDFEDSLCNFRVICDDIFCLGDLNINFLDLNCSKTRLFMDCIESFNLKQIISTPTRITRSSSTLLDIIIVSNDAEVASCGAHVLPNVSDHSLVYCQMAVEKHKSGPYYQKIRNLKYIDMQFLNSLLIITPFDDIFVIPDINEKVKYFNNLLITLYDTIAPVKTVKIMKRNPPWLTQNVRFMIKLRDNALNKYKRTNNPIHFDYYKSLRNQTNIVIRNEKKFYIEHRCQVNKGKEVWNKLRELNIYNKSKINPIPEVLKNPNDINNFFLRHSLNNNIINRELLDYYNKNYKTNFDDTFSFSIVTENIVYKYLLEIKSKSSGADNINIDMLLLCCPYILSFLTHIINTCLSSNVFPDEWKIAKILPLPKKRDPVEYNDLRPISILPVLSKLLEKIMYAQIIIHVNKYNVLPSYQSGFRTKHSCATALLTILDDILEATDRGESTALILIDYSKAFDTINHHLLFAILHFVGFSQEAIYLITCYLTNRQQYVEIGPDKSNLANIGCGVPQGSILGPLLFCIYTCNITACLKYCKPHLYADDTQVYFSFLPNRTRSAETCINEDLDRLVTISENHNLHINNDKSSLMIFGKSKNLVANDINISIKNNKLVNTDVAKNLGVILDTDLRFKKHISKCTQKAFSNLKSLYPHRHLLSQKLKIQLTDSLVLSHFNYCDTVYDSCLDKNDIYRIERIQKACLRFIYGIKKYCPVSYKLIEAKWLSMSLRRKLHSISLYHSILIHKSPQYLHNKIKYRSDVHNLNLRFRGLISPPPHRSTMYRRSFSFNIYFHYNKVPNYLKSLGISSFKNKFKEHLFNS